MSLSKQQRNALKADRMRRDAERFRSDLKRCAEIASEYMKGRRQGYNEGMTQHLHVPDGLVSKAFYEAQHMFAREIAKRIRAKIEGQIPDAAIENVANRIWNAAFRSFNPGRTIEDIASISAIIETHPSLKFATMHVDLSMDAHRKFDFEEIQLYRDTKRGTSSPKR